MNTVVCLNGKFVAAKDAQLSALSHGLLYGYGLFETMYYCDGWIAALDKHLGRLYAGARFIGLKLMDKEGLVSLLVETARRNCLCEAGIRLSVWESPQAAQMVIKASVYQKPAQRLMKKGMKLWVSPFTNPVGSELPRLKTLGYLPYLWSYRQGRRHGCDEAVLLTERGTLSEASRSNIFFVRSGRLCTPALCCGPLEGVTRSAVMRLGRRCGIEVEEGVYTLEELTGADEAFVTGSLKGIVPVRAVGSRRIGRKMPGPLTGQLIKAYKQAIVKRSI